MNIEMMMPKILAKNHKEYMVSCIETGKHVIINKPRDLFANDKEGYLIKMLLLVTLDINSHTGLNYFGAMLPKFNEGDVIVTDM